MVLVGRLMQARACMAAAGGRMLGTPMPAAARTGCNAFSALLPTLLQWPRVA
jgi:hypothetical protein